MMASAPKSHHLLDIHRVKRVLQREVQEGGTHLFCKSWSMYGGNIECVRRATVCATTCESASFTDHSFHSSNQALMPSG